MSDPFWTERDKQFEANLSDYPRLLKALEDVLEHLDIKASVDEEAESFHDLLQVYRNQCTPATYPLIVMDHLNRAGKSRNKGRNMKAIAEVALELCRYPEVPIPFPLDQYLFSSLMTTSNEPTVLIALCSLFLHSPNSTEVDLIPLAHRTMLTRCLDLLSHPSQSLREAATHALLRVFNDCAEFHPEEFDDAAKMIVTESRAFLAWPRTASNSSFPTLLTAILTGYPHYAQDLMGSGIMDDVLSLLYMDALPLWSAVSWAQLLEVFIEGCCLEQISDLVESGLISLLLSWVKKQLGGPKNAIIKIIVRVYRAGDRIRKERQLETNPFAPKYLNPTLVGEGWRNNETIKGVLNRYLRGPH
eukprot:Protomagalhaensia_sp_Gyna_25__547@NODE_1257_length_2013_cov_191_559777_g1001_i0_p1_GENE_NODE_1257_length_2013_cov_191_559777_g1001_i0NODE_1257_length_2013_cov_191_559777_g1001_i0_p1_ORF_typecomplete_len359_score47_49Adaptin_N/PF01602_20/0_073Arm/PF00514_23/0_94Arm/PF00514_23/6_5e02FANCI_S4/PF14678_6/0_38FANCI_S4/PF14678_6/3_8e03DUF1722/PF08349_11/0_36_NODE_1257_length_2013_cov_191_559777_g1001_i07181794